METQKPVTRPKKRKKIFDRRSIFFSCIVLVFFVVLVALELNDRKTGETALISDPIDHRALASKLRSVGLNRQAAKEYEAYLRTSKNLPRDTAANIAYAIGKIFLEEAAFEEALQWFYQVEMYDENTKLKPEVGAKIVHTLERLHRGVAAQYALDARSKLDADASEEDKGGEIVAKIGNDEISRRAVEEALAELPPYMKNRFKGDEGRIAFAKKYVAEEMLYRKALKLEYDKLPEVRKQIERISRELLVQKIIQSEIQDKVRLSDDDIELYYKAHAERYSEPEKAKISLIQVDSEESAKTLKGQLHEDPSLENFAKLAAEHSLHEDTKKRGGKVDIWVNRAEDPLGLGDKAAMSSVFFLDPGDISEPTKIGDSFYFFRLNEHVAARQKPLDEVKLQVTRDYRSEKTRTTYETLMKQALTDADVKFYPDVFASRDDEGDEG